MTNQSNNLHDPERMKEILRLKLHTLEGRDSLADLTKEVTEKLDMPISAVSIVLDEAQYFLSHQGLSGWIAEAEGTPVEWSFCANSVKTGQPFIVENASQNDIVKDNPLVTTDGIQCYLGVPLKTSRGHIVGNLCALDAKERTFSDEDLNTMKELAQEVVKRLEERASSLDNPTS